MLLSLVVLSLQFACICTLAFQLRRLLLQGHSLAQVNHFSTPPPSTVDLSTSPPTPAHGLHAGVECSFIVEWHLCGGQGFHVVMRTRASSCGWALLETLVCSFAAPKMNVHLGCTETVSYRLLGCPKTVGKEQKGKPQHAVWFLWTMDGKIIGIFVHLYFCN